MKYKTTVIRDGEEVPVTVEVSFVRASGDGWNEPREPAHYEIEDASVELTDEECERIEQELKEWRDD